MKSVDLSIKLSIIIPYYNTWNELFMLTYKLRQQKTKEVEIIVIDDGCDEKRLDQILDIKVIHLKENSGGASVPRNVGLDNAKGKYIVFIDADDLVSDDYIETILNKTKEEWDYCFISWQGKSNKVIIKKIPPTWNCCVWNCIYKRELIGNNRFDPKLKMAEDYDFNQRVRRGKRANIRKILYYYNEDTPESLTKQGKTYNNKYI